MGEIGALVGDGVSLHLIGLVERGAHAIAHVDIPVLAIRVHASIFPDLELLLVRAGVIATGHEGRAALGDLGECFGSGRAIGNASRVVGRADDHEVVVHERDALDAITGIDEFFFARLRMNEQQVRITHLALLDGGTSASRGDLELVASFLFEGGLQVRQKTGVVHRRGGGKANDRVFGRGSSFGVRSGLFSGSFLGCGLFSCGSIRLGCFLLLSARTSGKRKRARDHGCHQTGYEPFLPHGSSSLSSVLSSRQQC